MDKDKEIRKALEEICARARWSLAGHHAEETARVLRAVYEAGRVSREGGPEIAFDAEAWSRR